MRAIINIAWNWLTSDPVLNALSVFSFFISLATFVAMLCFKRRIRIEFDKHDFRKNSSRLVKEFRSMHDSLQDGLYSKDFLQKIDSVLDEVLVAYSFISPILKIRIRIVEFYIQHLCIPDAEKKNNRRTHTLCKQLRRIDIYIRKED